MPATPTQLKVLRFLRDHLAFNGYQPSVREIQRAFGFASPNAAAKHLRALEAQGLVELPAHPARGIQLVGGDDRMLRRLQVAADTGQALGFVFRDRAALGNPSPAALRLESAAAPSRLRVHKCRGSNPPAAVAFPRS